MDCDESESLSGSPSWVFVRRTSWCLDFDVDRVRGFDCDLEGGFEDCDLALVPGSESIAERKGHDFLSHLWCSSLKRVVKVSLMHS